MQLISLDLFNFRQFKNEHIDFAKGLDNRNVTICIGDNGAGKSTVAQAFFWCMYGTTDFSDKVMLNRDVEQSLLSTQSANVRVTIKLVHGELNYTLTREQKYTKTSTGKIQSDIPIFNIEYKDINGNQKFVPQSQNESEVKSILPRGLANYFFFDGERIEKMGKEISSDKKITDFENAVKGLLGLNAIMEALKHMKPQSRSSVIGLYNNSFDKNSDKHVEELINKINLDNDRVTRIDAENTEYDETIRKANSIKRQKEAEIRLYKDGAELQESKNSINMKLKQKESDRYQVFYDITKDFSSKLLQFTSLSMIEKAMKFIEYKDLGDQDIPFVRKEMLEYILEKGTCICSTTFSKDSKEANHIKKLIAESSTKSLNAKARDFKIESRERLNNYDDIFISIKTKKEQESRLHDEIDDLVGELNSIESKLSGDDMLAAVKSLNQQIKECEYNGREAERKKEANLLEKGSLIKEIDDLQQERTRLNAKNATNKKIERCLAYANRIYNDLKTIYDREEIKIRDRLENTINDLFKTIYNGELHLVINENYHIDVIDDSYNTDVETSAGQSISVIFAFIASIIKMARENGESEDEDKKILSSETYPLVMDAPLSTFDKKRIDTVCKTLPTIAEQVIIFIKDTDGDLAKEKLGSYIGVSYSFNKINQFTTTISKVEV